jgi:TATA-box binding protein (TBP) (component of TFIID and TFIIIB)
MGARFFYLITKYNNMNFKISSYQLNEHKNELVLYVSNKIFCTICCKDKANKITDNEIEDVISDIEWEQNKNRSQGWNEYLAK